MSLFDGLFDEVSGGKDSDASSAMLAAIEAAKNVDVPEIEAQRLQLLQKQQQGRLTPELEQALTQQDSGMGDIVTDPRLKQAQLAALSSLGDVANNGGMTAQDQSRMNQMLSAENQQEQGNRQAIQQDMARRGQSGSGFDLVSQMMNQQGSANRAAQQGMDIKAQAEARALQAMMGQGQMAGQMQAQDFGQHAQAAQAQDAINHFNTQNRQDIGMRNAQGMNQAQQYNLGEQQRIADTNTDTKNQQQQFNKGLYQTKFNNDMAKATGMANVYQNQASLDMNQAKDRRGFIGGLVGAGAKAYGSPSGGGA